MSFGTFNRTAWIAILLLCVFGVAAKASATLTIVSTSGSTMYTDFANGLNSTYLVFQVTNDATTYADVWAQLDTHGGNISNAGGGVHEFRFMPGGNGAAPIGEIGFPSAGETKGVFFMVTAAALDGTGQTLTVNLYDGDPSGSPTLLATQDFTFTVAGSIQANANKVTSIVALPPNAVPGDLGTVTVTGCTGTTKGGIEYFSPVSAASWPADTFEFVDSDINIAGYANNDYKNIAKIPPGDVLKADHCYTEVFTFVIDDFGTATTSAANFISSGGNVKHTTGTQSAFSVVPPSADIVLLKTQTNPLPANNPVLGGSNVTYHISATNNGPNAATTVAIGDGITAGSATFVSFANATANLDCFTTPPTSLPFTCTAATLANGDVASFDVTVTVPNDGTTSITNTASVTIETPTDSGNPSSAVITPICPSVDLSITKVCETFCPPAEARDSICVPTPIVNPIPGGSDFAYFITVTNNDGLLTAHSVVLNDALPAGVTFDGVSPNPCVSGTIPLNTCNLGDIAAGGSVSFTIHVTANDSGTLTNTASVTETECDPDTNNNSASCEVIVATNNTPTALEADREASSTDTDCITTNPISTSSDHNRVFEPAEEVRIDPTWHNNLSNADPDIKGTADTPTSPSGGTLTIEDCTADYGPIPANTDADCNSTGDCYQMKVTEDVAGVRPHLADHPLHWDTTFHETLSSGETKTWTLHIGDTFPDVPRANGFYRFIETILHNRLTIGCQNGLLYCPADPVVRAQIAAFVARSLAGNDTLVPTSSGDYNCSTGPSQFTDVTTSNGFCKHINYLKDLKVVNGCTPTTFCPADDASRGAVAVVVARGFEVKLGNTADPDGSIPLFGNDTTGARAYNCDSVDHTNSVTAATITAGTPPFPDVPTSGDICKSVGALYAAHVVDGSDPTHFNPNDLIRRDQAAKILTNEFINLPLYGPLTF